MVQNNKLKEINTKECLCISSSSGGWVGGGVDYPSANYQTNTLKVDAYHFP